MFFAIQELQPHEEHDFDVVRRLTVSVGDRDGKLHYAADFSRGTVFVYNGLALANSGYPLFPETMQVGDHLQTFPPPADQTFTGATSNKISDSGDETTVDPMLRSLAASRVAVSYVVASTRDHESWAMPSLVEVENIDRLQLFKTCVAALRAPTQHPAIAP